MERPETLNGKTLKISTGCGNLYLTLNFLENQLYEIKITLGKSGNCVRGLLEHIAILYSVLLQSSMDKKDLIKIFKKYAIDSNCGNSFIFKGTSYCSCLDYIAQKILEELK